MADKDRVSVDGGKVAEIRVSRLLLELTEFAVIFVCGVKRGVCVCVCFVTSFSFNGALRRTNEKSAVSDGRENGNVSTSHVCMPSGVCGSVKRKTSSAKETVTTGCNSRHIDPISSHLIPCHLMSCHLIPRSPVSGGNNVLALALWLVLVLVLGFDSLHVCCVVFVAPILTAVVFFVLFRRML